MPNVEDCRALPGHRPEAAFPPRKQGLPQAPLILSRDDLVLCRPGWADFDMERAYWDGLEDICESEQISPSAFVASARLQHAGMCVQAAVRTAVAKHFGAAAKQA